MAWKSPTSVLDAEESWLNEAFSIDENYETYARETVVTTDWHSDIRFSFPQTDCDKFRVRIRKITSTIQMRCRAYWGGGWHDWEIKTLTTEAAWYEFDLGGVQNTVSQIQLNLKKIGISSEVYLYEVEYNDAEELPPPAPWLTDWMYRKAHNIASAVGAGTNYQKRIKVDYSSGSDSGELVYLDGKCRADFGDIRFTDNDGVTHLDYWLQEKVDSDYAIFWVEVSDDLSTEFQTIYVYYGKASAIYPVGADQDEMDATFLFADHFYGSSLNAAKWDLINSPTINITGSIVTVTSSTEDWRGLLSDNAFGIYGIAWISRNKFSTDARTDAGMSNDGIPNNDDEMSFLSPTLSRSRTVNEGSFTDNMFNWTDAYHIFEITWKAGQCRFFVDGVLKTSHTTNIPNETLKVWMSSHNTSQNSDWVAIRKFVFPEPTHGAWGDEESEPKKIIIIPETWGW